MWKLRNPWKSTRRAALCWRHSGFCALAYGMVRDQGLLTCIIDAGRGDVPFAASAAPSATAA